MAGSPVRTTTTTPGITINKSPGVAVKKSRDSLSSESDLTEMSLSPSSSSFLSSLTHLVPTRRNRTASACQRAVDAPEVKGKITHFFRQKGHGFIAPENTDGEVEKIFVHVSDIDSEVVPQVGDSVTYRPIQIPPKHDKLQATHVLITKFNGERHFTWDGHPVPDQVD